MRSFKAPELRTRKKPPTCCAVIAAAGSSQRCKGEDKLLYNIRGKPVLAYTIEAFENFPGISDIILTVHREQIETIAGICKQYHFFKVSKIIAGGKSRTESVYNGVFATSDKVQYIAIHDGARPFIDSLIIEKTLETAIKYHAAAPGTPVISTIKKANISNSKEFGPTISETIDRSSLFEIQTPQIFKAEIIKAALTKIIRDCISLTDECAAVEMLGIPVHIVEGNRRNMKITDRDDLFIAEALL